MVDVDFIDKLESAVILLDVNDALRSTPWLLAIASD